MKNNTIITAGDRNYLWGIFLMIASLRRNGMDEPVIVGTCGVRRIAGCGEITNVAVLPEHRGFGIARRMLEVLIAEAAQQEVAEFTLEVRAGNVPAIRTYEHLGFRTEGVRPGFYEEPKEDALIMWRRPSTETEDN